MIDPQYMAEAFKKTSTLPNPTIPTGTPTPFPVPSLVPALPIREVAHAAGEKTLWVVFAVMFISSVVFAFLAYRTPVQKRLFHVLTTFITVFATLSYFAMATGAGSSLTHIILKEHHKHNIPPTHDHVFREVFWARYIDWSVTTPLLLLDLAFLAGLNGANILVTIVADVIMVLTGLFAAFGKSNGTKWGWYTMACVAYLVIVYQLAIPGRRAVKARSSATTKLFASLGLFTLVLWTLYPIVWGISDGARKWSVDTEIIAYAVLDILAKPVFGFWLLFAHGKNAETIDGFWAHGLAREGAIRIQDDDEV